uniref:V-type proton ATPase subunit a n=1 Tax=Glossina pallidipes TaxID=7398 RepID=A0A1A9ZXG5_GLOPL
MQEVYSKRFLDFRNTVKKGDPGNLCPQKWVPIVSDMYFLSSVGDLVELNVQVLTILYTCITFPVLFAVMFGDLGHGFILTPFATWTCMYEKSLSRLRDEAFSLEDVTLYYLWGYSPAALVSPIMMSFPNL